MSFFVFRNYTVEHLFEKSTTYSGYDEFTNINSSAKYLVWLYFLPLHINEKKTLDLINNYIDRLNYVLANAQVNQILIVFTLSPRLIQTKFENSKYQIEEAVNHFNDTILSLSNENSKIKVINIDDFFGIYSKYEIIDWKYYFLSKMIVAPQLSNQFKAWFQKKIEAINYNRKKCLILDLDNTLWGGILGEDGLDGIKLGGDYPGNAFKEFQELIKESTANGVVLAICSKNNLIDVKELWATHPELVLKDNDFSCIRINWDDKAANVLKIGQELNIGLDSMVFIDDNPRERERVKSELPIVAVPDFPEEPYELLSFFNKIYSEYFQIYKLTQEDIRKTQQYKENSKRNKVKSSLGTMDDFIKNLEIELSFFENKNISRVAQMSQKTNQFNLTTQRYSEADLHQFIKKNRFVFSLGVKDKFGDNGITAAAIVEVNENDHSAIIDSFLLSCRILGKDIENTFLDLIKNTLKKYGVSILKAKYIKSKKNGQTEEFYDKSGFLVEEVTESSKKYKFLIKEIKEINNNYKINII
jgi:FkbH-like protein